jgi:hypothetical protein
VLTYRRGGVVAEGVEDPDGECLVHLGEDLFCGPPFDGGGLVGGVWLAGVLVGMEDQGDDVEGHVFVDAGEPADGDVDAGFFLDFASEVVFDSLVAWRKALLDNGMREPQAVKVYALLRQS